MDVAEHAVHEAEAHERAVIERAASRSTSRTLGASANAAQRRSAPRRPGVFVQPVASAAQGQRAGLRIMFIFSRVRA